MNPITFAMRHPITTMMGVVALVAGGTLALTRTRIDIFPPINQPLIYVICSFGGMDPGQMEGLIVNQFELAFQYVDGVKDVESKCIQQMAIIKLSFFPDTDMAKAMASVVSMVNRAQATMPPNVLPPLVMQMDAGSVPVGYLVLQSDTRSLGEMGDAVQVRIRPLVQKYVRGTIATAPFGTNVRSIVVTADPDRLRSYNLTPDDIVQAIGQGNTVTPSGNIYTADRMPLVPTNAMIVNPKDFGAIPLRSGTQAVYIRDVATVADATDLNYGYALVNGRKSVYLPIIKKNTASTLDVVANVYKYLPVFKAVLPDDVDIHFAFDESPTVRTAISNVGTEGAIGASLTGLMILLFLRDWRSVIVVVFNIPMALLGALLGLWLTGNTINIMTLGGMALAIGILVDEATVSIENIHVQMTRTPSLARAVQRGSNETAVPRFLALLCILSVFIPAFIMAEPVRSLFVPLAMAVGFAMITSFILSSTVVPVLSVWLLKPHAHPPSGPDARRKGLFDRFQRLFGRGVGLLVRLRWVTVPLYLLATGAVLGLLGPRLGTELFPQVDSGEFVFRFKAPPGTHYEITRQIAAKSLQVIQEEAGAGNVAIAMGFAGQQAPVYALNNLILFMKGPDDGQMRVALKEASGIPLASFRERLRHALPEKVRPWLAELLQRKGLPAEKAQAQAALLSYGFEPGDIVSEVMSFGSPTPIEVVVASPNLSDAKAYARRVKAEMEKIPFLRDLQIQQNMDYPTVPLVVDRERAGMAGLTAQDVVGAVLVATSSSRYVARNYWRDPTSGVDYQVEVIVPPPRMDSPQQVETIPVRQEPDGSNVLVRDLALVQSGTMPGEIDRSTMQRYLSVTANVEGEDLGRAGRQIHHALNAAGNPPKGVRVEIRGQIAPMDEMFRSLAIGLAIAVAAILIMLTAYFESPRLALASVASVPGVLAGVVVMLILSGTTLNIESFMGSIMCIGVSVSNSVMLVTFIAREWREHKRPGPEAARLGAEERLRPILMTACAMTVGMIPMALALERGSEMQAPLGRAVIGGLVMSTFATLLVVPSVFALLVGHRPAVSPSVDPDDPNSPHHDPSPPDDRPASEKNLTPESHTQHLTVPDRLKHPSQA